MIRRLVGGVGWLLAVVAILLLCLAPIVEAASPATQKWYLSKEPVSTGSKHYKMTTASPTVVGNAEIPKEGGVKYWLAEDAASTDVTFPSGSSQEWTVYLELSSTWENPLQNCVPTIGRWTGETFVAFPNASPAPTLEGANLTVTITYSEPITVYQGEYLALEVKNNDLKDRQLKANGQSYLQSPIDDPSPPLPELGTLAMLGVGLVALGGTAGLALMRRHCSAG